MQTIDTSESQQTERAQLMRELSAMLAQLSVLQSIARPDGSETLSSADVATLRDGLATLEQMAREMLYEARSAEDMLSHNSLPDVPLAEALARAVDETAEAMQISSRVAFSGEERSLSGEVEQLLYHITLAALAQVRQHSGARKLRFTLHYESNEIVMNVEDDGVPVERALPSLFASDAQSMPVPPFTAQVGQHSRGPDDDMLARLRNRAEMLGGSLEVITSIEHGTQVQARLPFKQQPQIREELVMDAIQSAPTNPVRILVVDSLAVTRAGLRRLLESYSDLLVIGEAVDTCTRHCAQARTATCLKTFYPMNWRRRCAVWRGEKCWCIRRLRVA
jgi:hypothetical protein